MALTQTTDSPTSNYAVMTPLYADAGTTSNGNLTMATAGNDGDQPIGSVAFDSQDSDGYYFIMRPTGTSSGGNPFAFGVATVDHANQKPRNDAGNAASWFFTQNGGIQNTSFIANGSWDAQSNGGGSINDYYQIAIKAGKMYCGRNGTWYDSSDGSFGNAGEAFSNLTGMVVPMFIHAHASTGTVQVEFGALGYTHAKPSGLKDITAANLYKSNAPAIEDGSAHFQTSLWSGNSSSQTVNQSGNSTFTPDKVWIKDRNFGNIGNIFDAVRGSNKGLALDTGTEDTNANGVTLGSGSIAFTGAGDTGDINTSGRTYVGWQWLAGNSTASNSDGSITSTVSVNQTAGFSIVTYTGTGSAATVGHGLGAAPEWIVTKKRAGGAVFWAVYHVGNTSAPETEYLKLNATDATADDAGYWNDTAPTSSVFSINNESAVNTSDHTYVAYCWCGKPGFSKFGSYEGNDNANGPFVELGFKPAFLIVKNIDAAGGWPMYDNARTPFNPSNKNLNADQAGAEYSPDYTFDLLSNGFKIRDAQAYVNDANTYIYMAFAEHPFAGTTPATAR
tara:strand:- start:37 stop:1716 length:1680 start_codon:yes stop_codon:yes gene_type:complete